MDFEESQKQLLKKTDENLNRKTFIQQEIIGNFMKKKFGSNKKK